MQPYHLPKVQKLPKSTRHLPLLTYRGQLSCRLPTNIARDHLPRGARSRTNAQGRVCAQATYPRPALQRNDPAPQAASATCAPILQACSCTQPRYSRASLIQSPHPSHHRTNAYACRYRERSDTAARHSIRRSADHRTVCPSAPSLDAASHALRAGQFPHP